MRYYKNMYVQEELRKKQRKIVKNLEAKKFQINMYLIALSVNNGNHLEIINSMFLLQKDYPLEDYLVVGLAKSHEEAMEIVEKITQEVYDSTNGADIRSYILRKEQEG